MPGRRHPFDPFALLDLGLARRSDERRLVQHDYEVTCGNAVV